MNIQINISGQLGIDKCKDNKVYISKYREVWKNFNIYYYE